jgi:hypothetical protein
MLNIDQSIIYLWQFMTKITIILKRLMNFAFRSFEIEHTGWSLFEKLVWTVLYTFLCFVFHPIFCDNHIYLRIEYILLKFHWGMKALTEVHFQWSAVVFHVENVVRSTLPKEEKDKLYNTEQMVSTGIWKPNYRYYDYFSFHVSNQYISYHVSAEMIPIIANR